MNKEKAYKCHFCKKIHQDLKELPFNRFICDDCIEYKCLNEFDSPSELDNINVVGLYKDKFEKYRRIDEAINYADSNNLGVKLYRIKEKLRDFRDDLFNYDQKLKKNLGLIKYEVNLSYEFLRNRIEKFRLGLLSVINAYESEAIENLTINKDQLNSSIQSFVDKNIEYLNQLSQASVVNLNYDFGAYESYLNNQLSYFIMSLNGNKLANLRPVSKIVAKNEKISFGSLEFKDDKEQTLPFKQIKPQTKSQTFSMDSILNLKSTNEFVFKSIYALINQEGHEIYVLYSQIGENSKLTSINKFGKQENEIFFDQEIFAMNSNSSNLIILHKSEEKMDQTCSIEASILDSELNFVRKKEINFLNFPQLIPIDLFIQNRKVFILTANFEAKTLTIFVYNLNFDLLNSFDLNENLFLNMSTKSYFRLYVKENRIYLKQKTIFGTRLDVIDSIYGTLVKRINLSYSFELFYVQNDLDLILLDENIGVKPGESIVSTQSNQDQNRKNDRLIFFSKSKYYVYDLNRECILFNCYFNQNSINLNKKFSNIFFFNTRNSQIVSLILN